MKRPSVAMWSQNENEWYIIDCEGKVTWFKDGQQADYAAFNNFLAYTEFLEVELDKLKEEKLHGTV